MSSGFSGVEWGQGGPGYGARPKPYLLPLVAIWRDWGRGTGGGGGQQGVWFFECRLVGVDVCRRHTPLDVCGGGE